MTDAKPSGEERKTMGGNEMSAEELQNDSYQRRLEANRAWKARNREHVIAWQKAYNAKVGANPDTKAKKNTFNRESAKRNYAERKAYDANRDREKVAARAMIRHRIASGYLVRGACAICGTTESVDAHHEDYAKPKEIFWLCRVHHKAVHDGKIILAGMESCHVG